MNTIRCIAALTLMLGVAGIWGCGGGISRIPNLTLTTLRSAPEQVTRNATTFLLDAYLWRDFMPPVNGEPPLNVLLKIRSADGSAYPTTLRPTAIWLMNGDLLWSATPAEVRDGETPAEKEALARRGPTWELGTKVDVVVRLQDDSGNEYLLQAKQRTIVATY